MSHVTLQNTPTGPLLDVVIGVSVARAAALAQNGRSVPGHVPVRALVDTGASTTCIDPAILDQLGLSPTGMTSVITPSTGVTPHDLATYDVSFSLPHQGAGLRIGTMPVIATQLNMHGIQGLVGRDILALCVLIYNGSAGFFTLAY